MRTEMKKEILIPPRPVMKLVLFFLDLVSYLFFIKRKVLALTQASKNAGETPSLRP
jgi:hypothetical protein